MTADEHAARVGVADREEVIGCDLCGERRVQPLFTRRAAQRKPWTYHVVRCPTCGFLYRNPGIQPARLGELYAGAGYGRFLAGKYERKRQRRYRLVPRRLPPGLRRRPRRGACWTSAQATACSSSSRTSAASTATASTCHRPP